VARAERRVSATLYREQSGRGEPLLLLHGWGMNLRVFDPLRARLAAHYEVTAIDLPGHGRSPWNAAQRNVGQALLAGVAASVPPGATLLGWSLGAQLALELARDPRLAISRLVLIAATPRFVSAEDWPHGLPLATLRRFASQLARDPSATVDEFLELQVRGSAAPEAVLAALRQAVIEQGAACPEALAAGLEFLEHTDQRSLARTLALPALVLSGQHDRITPPAAGLAFSQSLPQGRWVEVRRAAHAPFLSHLELVSASVLEFLGREPAADARQWRQSS
jgi:pimeloyl-[acyl-carrier protein] methyl ester esterase